MRKKVLATITAASIATSTVMSPVSVFAQSVKQAEGTVDVAEAEAYDYSNVLKNTEFKINPDKTIDHWDMDWLHRNYGTLTLNDPNELFFTSTSSDGTTVFKNTFRTIESSTGERGFTYTGEINRTGTAYATNVSMKQKLDNLDPMHEYELRLKAKATKVSGETLKNKKGARLIVNSTTTTYIPDPEFQEYKIPMTKLSNEISIKAESALISDNVRMEVRDVRLVDVTEENRVIDEGTTDVNALFKDDNPANTIKETVTQADIDAAQAKVDAIKGNPDKTAELQAHVDKAQAELDAKTQVEKETVAEKAVNELFEGNNPANKMKETVTQADIDAAQAKVDAVTDPAKKAELQAHIDKAQAEFDAKKEAEAADKEQQAMAGFLVNQLYQDNNPATDAIKATTNQATIGEAQAQIDKLLPSAVKTDLQNKLNRAQELLNAKNTAEADAQKVVNELFEGNNPANKMKETVTQADIDAAQAKVDDVTDPAKKAELQAHVDKAQAEFDAKKEAEVAAEKTVNELFEGSNPANKVKETVTQADIDAAQAKVNAVTDLAKKEELQAHVDKAQAEFDAKKEAEVVAEKAVNELFEGSNPANKVKETVTQADIDAAQAKVDAVTDLAKKEELQAHVDKAQAEFDAKKEAEVAAEKTVNELFEGNNPANKVKETVKQTDIDAAQAKVDAVTNPAKKAELQAHVDKAQAEFDATHAVIVAPKVQTVSNKDTVVTGTGTPGYTAVVTIGGTTYTGMIGANGSFSVTIPAQKADTIFTVVQNNGLKTGPATTVKVVNYIPDVAPIVDNVAVFQQAITGKVPAGTLSVRLIVNGIPQRLVAPDAQGNFSFYSRFISDGTVSNLRLKEGDVVTVDYGNRTPAHLATTTTVSTATKPILDTVYEATDYVSGLVPTGTQVLRLSINGVPQRTVTPQENIDAVTAGGIASNGRFKIYSRFFKDETGVSRKLKAGDTVTVDLGVQIPGDTGTTVTVVAK
ncbi:hypothetical protein HCJ39_10085 [Listeria rocourtiae]|uniref:toxin Cry1Ac domain D-VI-related protein n=1 Tax=Listeria rocourtiae TaxID=647910 RepID=UPI001625D417|nr:toxin Cry1Ac domain D-VI-related protein [Listeria rocourtiae]MBC1605063.1 hypothetical protein [Listeria rocourtiae]